MPMDLQVFDLNILQLIMQLFVLDPDGRNIEAACLKPGFLARIMGAFGWSVVGMAVGAVGGVGGKYMGWL